MRNLIRKPAKLLLGLVTSIFPVFIAACYGCPEGGCGEVEGEEMITGAVSDIDTGNGIYGIEVSCLGTEADAATEEDVIAATYTMEGDGAFQLSVDPNQCAALRFTDVDGDENGGIYESVTLPKSEFIYESDVDVEMNLQE